MGWLLHVLGVNPHVTGSWYSWWSGAAGDLGWIGGAGVLYRRHQCHRRGCWRLARHPHGPYVLCARHHPHVPDEGPDDDHIREALR